MSKTNSELSQGDIRKDGAIIALVVAPEDLIDVASQAFDKTLTLRQAKKYIRENGRYIVDAFLNNWMDILPYAYGLDDFVEKHGKVRVPNEDEEE